MKKSEGLWLLVIVGVALGLRIYMPWPFVFGGARVNLLETDAWYHLRVIEHLAQQFPFRLTADPYVGGAFLKVPPLLDYLVAGAAWVLGAGHPSETLITRIAVFTPPMLAVLTIGSVFALTRRAYGSTAALIAAAFTAILPGHFLDRTLLGYVDHHALEAVASLLVLGAIAHALTTTRPWWHSALAIAAALLVMRLSWTSAAMIFAIVGLWLACHVLVQLVRGTTTDVAVRAVGAGAVIALVITRSLPWLEPFGVYLDSIALGLVAAIAGAAELGSAGLTRRWWSRTTLLGGLTAAAVVAGVALPWLFPSALAAVATQLGRFGFTATLGSVLEARPLFMYHGTWSLQPAWQFFGTGIGVGLVGTLWLVQRWWRDGRPLDLLLIIWTVALLVATIGINRFGYYLVPALAIVGGMVCAALLHAGRQAGGWRRPATVVLIAAGAVGVNLGPALEATTRPSGVPNSWLPAFEWLRNEATAPFDDPDYYFARYGDPLLPARSTVMTWWDYGYTVLAAGRQVPVAIPTGAGAVTAARFFSATDVNAAVQQLEELKATYVFVDELLPLSLSPGGALVGKFQAIAETAGRPFSDFVEIYLLNEQGMARPVFLFHEDYYRSMAYRLGALGGRGAEPTTSAVVSWEIRGTATTGFAKVITRLDRFATYDEARARLRELGEGNHAIVGTNPRATPIPLEPVLQLPRRFVTSTMGTLGEGVAQIFERIH